jgi:hypothetical protein
MEASNPGVIEVEFGDSWVEKAERAVYDQALRNARQHASTPTTVRVNGSKAPRRVNGPAGRPKAQSSRSSARSGDSGDDPGPSDPADWHWSQPAGWGAFVASVQSRDFERELHRERMGRAR